MTTTTYSADALLNAARAAAQAFLAALDETARGEAPTASMISSATAGPVKYDPLRDQPPFTPNPAPGASDAQKQLAYITYLGAIGRINADHGRGANSREVSEYAKKAGYPGGNAVNGWNSRPGSPRAIENQNGARWLNDETLDWIGELAGKLHIELEGTFAAVPKSK